MISCTGRRQVADRVSIKIYIFFNDSATHHSFNANRKSTSQINSKKCSCCRAYQSLIQWINFDFILKPVSFHLKFVMLHNDSLLSQILLSTAIWHHGFRNFIFNFNTALHLPGFCHLPSEGSVLRDRLPHVLLKSAYLRNQFPSSFSVAGSR